MTENETEEPQRVVVRDKRRVDPSGSLREPDPVEGAPSGADAVPDDATRTRTAEEVAADDFVELRSMQALLDERTADLQRLKAEFDNYRRRVDRDRQAMAEQAVAGVLLHLLPVLDDVDRAREHGEVTGGFKSVADALDGSLAKLGLERYGAEGDPFDPMLHEAVTHQHSDDVTEATCVSVMRPGYRFAERLLRPAMVAVAEPAASD
ncbi:MAG TPA: nucleotide exchange factor GrpE [Frankiaceae bacterium]|nr:nucleotide exchange factor GrpE [Frankiaceae bacterium]